ncbi:Filamentous haemagglutinin, N-terminal [Burkholderiales bacterium]
MRTDPSTTHTAARALRQLLLGTTVWMMTTAACAQAVLPSGGQVVSGQASIEANNGSMTVRQSTHQAIVNWDTFNVGRDQSVQFIAPSAQSTTFNRILDANPSQIMGRIQANGQLIFSNPQGVVFGATAQVDVGGLIVTVHNLSNEDFLAGRWHFTGGAAGARVENSGRLQAELGGHIALLAPEVRNDGVVLAREGTVAMAAGEAVTLQFAGSRRLSVVVDAAVMNALVSNRHVIRADGGVVVLSARSANAILESVIQQSGEVTAQSLVNQNGRIFLQGGERGVVGVEGQLNARGAEAGTRGGEILVTGDKVFVGAAAALEASGPAGGGEVLVGGGWQGQDPRINSANAVVVASGARLDASASEQGDGGTVVVWSDTANPQGVTRVAGDLRARGGPQGGDGGRIETSGANLDVQGVTGDASAPMGVSGEWLFDPYNVTITSATANGAMTSDVNNGSTWTPSADNSTILNTTINTLLEAGTDVTVTTTGAGVQDGDIVVDAAITRATTTGRATLSLTADRNITINQAINIAGSGSLLQLTAGGSSGAAVGFRAPVTVDTLVVNASGTGAINQGATAGAAALTVTNLGLNAPLAAVDLKTNQIVSGTTITNSLGTVAGNVASLDLLAGTGVSVANASHGTGVYVGTVSSLSGLTTTGALNLRVTDTNLYVNSNVVAGGNLVLNAGSVSGNSLAASAANLIVSDTASISTGGQGLLYTGAVAEGSANLLRLVPAGSGRFRYNSNEGSTGYSAALESTGLHVIYREQPTLTASIGSLSRTYGSIGSLTPSISGLLNGDTQALAYTVNPSVSVVNNLTSTSGNTRVGTYSLTVSTGTSALGYAVLGGSGSLAVTKRALTTSAIGNNRVYDQSTTASAALSNDAIGTDKVISKAASASFLDKNVANNKTITVVGINISGTEAENVDAGNYDVANTTASTTADITPLGISAVYSAQNKVYDGTDTAAVTANVSAEVISGDTVSAVASGTFADKNVGTAKAVSVTAGALTGTDAGNYSVSNPTATVNANITAKTVALSAAKVYDGDTALTGSEVTITTGVGSETLGFSSATASNENVATAGKFINAITLVDGTNGGLATNYQLPTLDAANAPVSITAKTVGLSAAKVYDGDTTLTGSEVTITTGVGSETLGFSSATASDKNVATAGKFINAITLADGTNGGLVTNYQLPTLNTANAPLSITAKTVGLSAAKVYDGDTTLTGSEVTIATGVGSETLGFSGATANDKNVATAGKFINAITLADGANDGLATNYQLPTLNNTNAAVSITAKTVGLSAAKVYDGDTALTGSEVTITTGVGTETLGFSSATANDKNVATAGKFINAITLADGANGGLATNYQLPTLNNANAAVSITAKPITVTGITASARVYDATRTANVSTAGVDWDAIGRETGDDLTFASVSGLYDNKNVGATKTITLTSTYSGTSASNYAITSQPTTTAGITVRNLSVTALANNKIYDATTAATYTLLSDMIATDSLVLSSASGVFNNKHVGTGKTVTVAGIAVAGTDAGNYQLMNTSTQTLANVSARTIQLNAMTAQSKVYDGSTSGTITGTLSVTPLLNDDLTLSASGAHTVAFSDKNVGAGKTVTVSNPGALAGADAGNYTLNPTATTTASITAKSLTISGITASDKVYDGNAVAQVDTSGVTAAVLQQGGLVASDAFAVAATGTFRNADNTADDKNVGVGKTVALTSTYSGADVTNYNITGQNTTTASITAKPITMSGITASGKVYDGGVSATVSTAALTQSYLEGTVGVVSGDSLTVTATGVFANKNAAPGKTVTLTSSYGGSDVANYDITDQASTTADVTPRGLTIVGITALDKFYDGSNVAFANVGSSTLSGLVAGDDVSLSSSGVFLDAAVGGNKPVLLTNTLAGNDVSNYSVTNQDTTLASIFDRVTVPVVPTATQTVVQFSPTTVRFVPQPVAVTSAAPAVSLPVSATSQPAAVAAAASAGAAASPSVAAAQTATTVTAVTTAVGTSPALSSPTAPGSVAATVAEAVAEAVAATPASAATLPASALSSLPTSVAQSIPAETLQTMSPAQVSSVLAALDPAQASALTTEQVAQVGDLFAAASDALGASTAAATGVATSSPAALAQASPGEVLALLPSLPAEARAALPTETLEAVQALISQALEAEKPTSESMGLGAGSRLAGASLPLSEVPQLTPDALQALTAQDMVAWDAAALQQLTAAQVATLPAETLAGLSAAQLAALDAVQLQELSASQLADVSALLTPAQLADLTTAQKTAARDVLASTATATETSAAGTIPALPASTPQEAGTSSLLGSAPADVASLLLSPSAISAEQLAVLPLGTWQQLDPLIIQQLSPAIISNVPLAAMATWSPEQIAALRGAQLSALSIPQLRVVYLLLAPAQFAQLPEAQVAGLRLSQRFVWVSRVGRNPALLQELLASAKRDPVRLDTQDLAQLGPREAARLSPVSIRQLEAAQISMLQPAVFSALSDQQVRALRSEQIASLDPSQLSSILPWLTSEQVRAITPGQLSGLRNLVESN